MSKIFTKVLNLVTTVKQIFLDFFKTRLIYYIGGNSRIRMRGDWKTLIQHWKFVRADVQSTPIPLDIALIVVASIVSLGLTSVAVVMVLHMRSKLLEAARLSIYEEAKTKSQENPNAAKISSIVTGSTLPREYTRCSAKSSFLAWVKSTCPWPRSRTRNTTARWPCWTKTVEAWIIRGKLERQRHFHFFSKATSDLR